MDIAVWITYIGVIAALIAFPGPSSLLITLHGYQYGLRRSNVTIAANTLGSFLLMFLSVLGLGLILSSSEFVFQIAKYIGAVFLIYIGVKTWRQSASSASLFDIKGDVPLESAAAMFSKGFLTGVSNPKDLIFFAALFPAFLNQEAPLILQFAVLVTTWLVVDYSIKLLYAVSGRALREKFSQASFAEKFNKITGGLFVCIGLALAGANR
ncbi:hypothetical protein AB835_06180 [Candidatus Endobugula sertula]|uniref:Lysine transporter LysE n=1 Tax=Candidatus Endobugula sertula TaxID=62101 RepID=A0A1D2QQY0_9GAMM|nr:hypothetical protein AB835_06180 [Candidatus Endobugula sertula]